MKEEQPIGLPEAIRSLRSELTEAMQEGAEKTLRFRVDPVELEFAVEVSREAGADGGIKFWVISAGAKGSLATSSTHRIKLTLHPVTGGDKDVVVADAVTGRPK